MTEWMELAPTLAWCPLEAGLVGKLVDHECRHGRLDGDRTPACGCWQGENVRAARRMET